MTTLLPGGEVEQASGLEQFRTTLSSLGCSAIHVGAVSNMKCRQILPFLDILCSKYPSVNFFKGDIHESATVATDENVRGEPTFKI